jgi:hypothetical protein
MSMASSDQPETTPASAGEPVSTGIQTPPEAPASPTIPLPPAPPQPVISAEAFTRQRGYFDAVLVALVLGFAFLIASSPVVHADFFRQLAAGRLVAHGDYPFGGDPFTYSAEGTYSVNHSWLFALLVYGLYQIAESGVAVVVAKALVVVLLAEILLRTSRRRGQSLWIPVVCTVLAILTASARMYVRPDFLSFLFLALTLWLLTAVGRGGGRWLWWLLPPLFAVWVNCDQWFFLGPLTVALYLVGELLQQRFALNEEGEDETSGRDLATLGLVLVVGLAACLVNPHHIHVFGLPPEFGGQATGDLAQRDPQFRAYLLSPLRQNYYDARIGLNVAGLTYWVLLVAGLASFVCVFGRAPWWRLLIWLTFALLSLYSARAIPFFAIVAGPITALNWLDFAAGRLGTSPRLTRGWQAWSLGGRILTAVLILGLLVATVPGWLQAQPFEAHRVGWRVIPEPSLEQAALQIKAWRDQGRLPAEPHWFNTRPEVANYLAWYAPGERAFMDQRLTESPEAAADYLNLREALQQQLSEDLGEEGADNVSLRKDWRRILRKHGVRFWIYDNVNLDRVELVARRELFRDPDEWPICYLHGRVAIFAWKDRQAEDAPDPSRGLRLDFARLAFGPNAETAPPEGPEAAPPRDWWEVWWKPATPLSPDRETAALQDLRYSFLTPRYLEQNSRAWQGAVATGAIGTALPHGPVPGSLLALSWSATYHALFPPGAMRPARQYLPREVAALQARYFYASTQDVGPTDALYLGIRAARRALRVNPEDSYTYRLLAQCYMRLNDETQERTLMSAADALAVQIRRTQIAAALQNCLRFNPSARDATAAHYALYRFFIQQRYLDVAINHLREYLNLARQEGPQPGQSPADFTASLDRDSKELTALDEQVQRSLQHYHVDAGARPPLQKVQAALERGLAETALQVLDDASPDEVKGQNELAIIGRLTGVLLDLGRLDKARDLLMPDPEAVRDQPVPPYYLNYHVRLAAAHGDYAEAERHLTDALNHAWKDPRGRPEGADTALQVGFGLARVLLAEAQHATGMQRVPWVPNRAPDLYRNPFLGQSPSDFWVRRWRMELLQINLDVARKVNELQLLRAWLALESGHNEQARRNFRVLSESIVPSSRWIPEMDRLDAFFDSRELQPLQLINIHQNVARALAQRYLKWLDEYAR